jgi:hypothetical protein
MSESPYDEVGSRTRQAWLRTSLGVVAVTLLVVRAMVIGGTGTGALLLALVPAGTFLTVAVARMAGLDGVASPGASRAVTWLTAASAVGLAVVGVVSVVVPG